MLKIYYSASLKGFLQSDINNVIPQDAVEITQEYRQHLLSNQSHSKSIVPDAKGYPVLQDNVVPNGELELIERMWRNRELSRSDIELYKVQDSDINAAGTVTQWREYRKALRCLPEHPLFPNHSARPPSPDNYKE